MEIKCYFVPSEIPEYFRLAEYTVVVIDVLRATSTISVALFNGCDGVVPVSTIDEAISAKETIRENVLLSGERDAIKIEGFDLGNSPQDFTKKTVRGKISVHTTTNGTIAINSVREAGEILIASFLNLNATVNCLGQREKIMLLCSGRLGEFSLEDTLCAGGIVSALRKMVPLREFSLSDSAIASEVLYRRFKKSLMSVISRSIHGRDLISKGLKSDIRFCLRENTHDCLAIFDKSVGKIVKVTSET